MAPDKKAQIVLDLLQAVHTFGIAKTSSELDALAELRAVVARAEFAAKIPVYIDNENPFDNDDDSL